MSHIIERFMIHFAASTFLTLAIFFALRFSIKKVSFLGALFSSRKQHLLVVAALIVFAVFPLREAWDVYRGNNTFAKSIFDQLSWFVGPIISVWGLSRFDKLED